ncbi:MAG: glycosyltransferase family 2 protein [Candidatus Moranbacteria bacterium]|nr:glycosyltransferase family 2 protein [Candidatus Moranbacteria bacterium]
MQEVILSIIIVNFKSRAYLEKCLLSVFAKIDSSISFEVIVVNNGARAEVSGLTDEFPRIKIIQSSQNSGFGNANNLGAKESVGEILFFLNPDAEIISADISLVAREFENNSTLGVIGAKLVEPGGSVQKWSAGGKITLGSVLKNNLRKTGDEKYWQSSEKVEVSWVAGTAMFIPRALFLQLGGFDVKFFTYFEDVDLCNRTQLLGKKVAYLPEFSVLHYGGKSFLERKEQKKNYYQSQDYYFQKHRGFFEAVLLKIFRFFSF